MLQENLNWHCSYKISMTPISKCFPHIIRGTNFLLFWFNFETFIIIVRKQNYFTPLQNTNLTVVDPGISIFGYLSLGSGHYLRQGGRWNSENRLHSKRAPLYNRDGNRIIIPQGNFKIHLGFIAWRQTYWRKFME